MLYSQIDVLQAAIDQLTGRIQQTENRIADLQVQIEERQKDFEQKKDDYYQRLRLLYISGGVTNLEVIMSSADFSSLLTRTQLVSSVSQKDQAALQALEDSMAQIKKDQAALEAEKASLQADKQSQDASMAELQTQKKNLANDMAESKAAAEALQQTKKSLENGINEDENSQKDLRSKINQILYPPVSNGNKPSAPIEVGDGIVTGKMIHPCPDRDYVSVYWPYYNGGSWHGGVDFACGGSTPNVYAADGGIVVTAGWSSTGYGNYIMIYHGPGLFTLYGHCSALYVVEGQTVSQGQVIASVGSTGNSSGNHLHFEVRLGDGSSNRNSANPQNYIISGKL